MRKEYLVNQYRALEVMQKLEKTKYEFRSFVNRFKKHLYKMAEEIFDDLDAWQEYAKEMAIDYCAKDENGKPIYIDVIDSKGEKTGAKTAETPLLGMNEEWDSALKEHVGKKKALLLEDVEVDKFDDTLNKKFLPDNFPGDLQEYIQDYIDG